MNNLHVTHDAVRKLVSALGKNNLKNVEPAQIEAFIADVMGQTTISTPVNAKLIENISKFDTTTIINTARVELIANAFGWKGDAFMHYLKMRAKKDKRQLNVFANLERKLINFGISNPSEFIKSLQNETGICFIAGPTGSGRSTTVEMIIHALSGIERSIFPLNDGELFPLDRPDICAPDTHYLRNLLNELANMPPQVIYLGDIQSIGKYKLLTEVAKNHLVITTFTSSNIQNAFRRFDELTELGCGDLNSLVRGVVVQHLMPTICDNCRQNELGRCTLDCTKRSRTAISECVHITSETQKIEIRNTKEPYKGLANDLRYKVTKGLISPQWADENFGSLWHESQFGMNPGTS